MKRFFGVIVLVIANVGLYAYWHLAPDASRAPPPAVAAVAPSASTPPKPEPAAPCIDVGPFNDREIAASTVDWFAQRGAVVDLREGQVDAPPEYAVEANSRSVDFAARAVQALHAAGIEEAEIQPADGDGSSVKISLGVFADTRHAEHRVTTVKRFGIAARIVPQPRTRTVWWVDLETREAVDLDALVAAVPGAAGAKSGTCPLPLPAEEPTPDAPSESVPPAEKTMPTVPQTRV